MILFSVAPAGLVVLVVITEGMMPSGDKGRKKKRAGKTLRA
jgi:hypothetical protein